MLSAAPVADEWRSHFPGTVLTWQNGSRVDISVAELLALDKFVIPAWSGVMSYLSRPLPPMQCHPTDVSSEIPIISWTELPSFSIEWLLSKVNDMNLIGLSQTRTAGSGVIGVPNLATLVRAAANDSRPPWVAMVHAFHRPPGCFSCRRAALDGNVGGTGVFGEQRLLPVDAHSRQRLPTPAPRSRAGES